MTPSAPATDAARRLWAGIGGDVHEPAEIAQAVARLGAQIRTGLGRWIGGDACRALLKRAVGAARPEHPALGTLSDLEEDPSVTMAAVQAHGAPAVVDGLVAVVALMIELLGRIIGQEMATHLVEQCGAPPRPHGPTHTEPEERTP